MEGIVMESVWVAVGFVVFVALIWRRVGAAVGGMLDDRSQKIKQDLDEARALRDEALEELHQFQRLHREAAEEAKAMLKNAEATAERIRENAEKAAAETVKRREVQASAKIKAVEAAMVKELRSARPILRLPPQQRSSHPNLMKRRALSWLIQLSVRLKS